MKKLATFVLIVTALSAFGQGAIIFQNASTQLVMLGTNALGYFPAPVVATHVAFYYAPITTGVTDPLDPRFHLINDGVGVINPIPGRFALGTKTTGTDVIGDDYILFTVRGWFGNYSNWDSAYAAVQLGIPGAYIGYTPVLQMRTVDPASQRPFYGLNNVPEFTGVLIGIPEPSHLPLAFLMIALVWKWYSWRRTSTALIVQSQRG